MRGQSGRTLIGLSLSLAMLFALALAIVLSQAGTARANNIVTEGTASCDGHWTYSAKYLGNGGGSADNRLVVIDVNVGGNVIRQYQYFDTITFAAHPAPPAGFTLIDNPT